MIDTKINPYVQRLIVSPRAFERQMRFLKEHHYNIVPLETLAFLIRDKKKIPPKTIAITFDDGNKDNYTNAFPILKKYVLPATMFIIVDEVGRPQGDRLSWDEIKVMRDSGLITFGSHSLRAEPLINIKSEEDLRKNIFDSKKILEEKLGCPVNAFSYPEGRFNDHIRKLVIDAGYKLAVTTNPGKKFPSDDIFALKRLRISSSSDNLFVFWIETSGFYTFLKEHRDKD
jgi:peptidoglycan/xylan/chitin deacetylase (PgdA/CDA1 family)